MFLEKGNVVADQFLLFASSILAILVGWLCALLWKKIFFMRPGNIIPGPKATIFGGNLQDLQLAGGPAGFCDYLEMLHSTYGPVTRLWLGSSHLMVSVRDPEMAKLVLINARDRSSPSPPLPLLNSMVFQSESEARLRRPFLDYHCHTTLMFKVHSLSTTVAKHSVEHLFELAREKREANVKRECRHMVTGVLGASLFGEKFLTSPLYEELNDLIPVVAGEQQKLWNSSSWSQFCSRHGHGVHTENSRRLKVMMEELVQMGMRVDEEKAESAQESPPTDFTRRATLTAAAEEFIRAMLAEQTVFGENLYSKETAASSTLAVMFHGCFTLANVLADTLVCLAQHPHEQAQVHREIDLICGDMPPHYEEQLDLMHYLTASIFETARLNPIQPILRRCSSGHDLKIGNYVVPAGATVAIPTQALQRDPAVWGDDAVTFNPERFLKRQSLQPDGSREIKLAQSFSAARANAGRWRGAALTLGNPGPTVGPNLVSTGLDPRMGIEGSDLVNQGADCYAFVDPGAGPHYLLFGAGPRACVGRRFSLHLLRALLSGVLQRFEIQMAPGSDPAPRFVDGNLKLDHSSDPSVMFTPRACC